MKKLSNLFIILLFVVFSFGCGKDNGSVTRDYSSITISFNGTDLLREEVNSASVNEVVEEDPQLQNVINTISQNGTGVAIPSGGQTLINAYENSVVYNIGLYEEASVAQAPTGMAGEIFTGYSRDIFFANGTTVTLIYSNADTSEYVHDTNLQNDLGNGLSEDNHGFGCIATWEDEGVTKYVYLSNMAEVFGGSYRDTLYSDTSIIIDGSYSSRTLPNISYVFGGGMYGNVIGNSNITVLDSQPMYVYGGGYNGSVYGNVNISYSGNSWSSEIVGGCLARALASDEKAIVYGDIFVNMDCDGSSSSYIICGGGFAESTGEFAACADVFGNTNLNINKYNVYELAGGGISYCDEAGNYASACVYGNSSIVFTNGKVAYSDGGLQICSGVLAGGGLASGGVALVEGDSYIEVKNMSYDRKSVGIVSGGICNSVSDNSMSGVQGTTTIIENDNKDNRVLFECDYTGDVLAYSTGSSPFTKDEQIRYPDYIIEHYYAIAKTGQYLSFDPETSRVSLSKAVMMSFGSIDENEADYALFLAKKEGEIGYYLLDFLDNSYTFVPAINVTEEDVSLINVYSVETYFVNNYFAFVHGGKISEDLVEMINEGTYNCYEISDIEEAANRGEMNIIYPQPELSLIWNDL